MQKKKNPSAFIRNTYNILQRPDLNHIIGWNQEGDGFIIHDLPKFQSQILPQYFKHQKYTSFVRQLNMYGFHKHKHPLTENYFQHETFRKGQNLSQIKRKPQKKKKNDQQMAESRKVIKLQQLKQNSNYHSEEHAQSEAIINPEGEQIQEDLQKQQSSQSMQPEPKTGSNVLGTLCQQAVIQNQILTKVHPTLLQQSINLKKLRLYLALDQSSSHSNLDTNSLITIQSMNEFIQILKSEAMRLYSIIDSSL